MIWKLKFLTVDKINKSMEEIANENKELAMKVIKEKGGKLDDELLSCR